MGEVQSIYDHEIGNGKFKIITNKNEMKSIENQYCNDPCYQLVEYEDIEKELRNILNKENLSCEKFEYIKSDKFQHIFKINKGTYICLTNEDTDDVIKIYIYDLKNNEYVKEIDCLNLKPIN